MIISLLFPIAVVVMSLLYLGGWFFSLVSKYQKEIDDNE